MAFLFDEQKFVEDNIFKYEDRLNSQISRFLDKSPSFVTYYHINNLETTVDGGFKDVESILSDSSPIRFQKIINFPIYGLEPVQLAIGSEDQGIDTSFSSSAVILPNTIKPLQNDLFVITHPKEGSFIFRVTEVQYDTIRPDNYYQIGFKLEYHDNESEEMLDNQVETKYSCVLENIGTENNCLLMEEYKEQIDNLNNLYDDMVKTYISIFYNKRYNCFMADSDTQGGYKIFDPLQSVFINTHRLLNKKSSYNTMILSEGFMDNKRKIKYEKSIYRFFERRDISTIKEFYYYTLSGTDKVDSAFAKWNDSSILMVDIPLGTTTGTDTLFSQEMISSFKYNAPQESKYVELMQKFARKEDITIYDIPLDLNEELLNLEASKEVYFFTPILLYIIQTVVQDFLSTK
jgi:hypothetical protein